MKLWLTGRPEPLLNRALIVALASAVLTLLDAFGVPITQEQQAAVNQFLAVLAPVIVALLARSHITPLSDPHDAEGHKLTPEGE